MQRFGIHPQPLTIVPLDTWLPTALAANATVSGPGLETFGARLATLTLAPKEAWLPTPTSLLRLGLERLRRGERDEPFAVEPLYLRASSAEEKWATLHPTST